jgi:hypothetical protein
MNPVIQLRKATPVVLVALTLTCFVLSPSSRAVSPAPDGGYTGGNTAEGQSALFNLSTGLKNTADGYFALFSNTTGQYNTATGSLALYSNTTGSNNTAIGLNALYHNTTGSGNIAIGTLALQANTGSNNIAIGNGVLQNFNGNDMIDIGDSFFSDGATITIGRASTLTFNCTLLAIGIPNAQMLADNDVEVGSLLAPR